MTPSSRFAPSQRTSVPIADIADRFDLELVGDGTTTVTSVIADNRRARDGDLFVALPGTRVHGILFARAALDAGAAAILTDRVGAEQFRETADIEVPVLISADPRDVIGPIAAYMNGFPASRMRTFAITGTNGKTTTTFLLDHILSACGLRTGLIGTVETRFGETKAASRLTTPEAPELQEWLAAMAQDSVTGFTMEVSSHSLAMRRVGGLLFDVAGFTNLSQDHLDFHGDLDSYFATKQELFTPAHAQRGVVVIDEEWGARLARGASIPVVTLRTVPSGEEGEPADWTVDDVDRTPAGTGFTLRSRTGRRLRSSVELPGDFNVTNAALALVMVIESGIDIEDVASALGADGVAAHVPGRMEVVAREPRVIVDFAHNAEALELALAALRDTTVGRLIVVFGATGERDTGKRPAMGRVAAAGADVVIVTDDDPYAEDPAQIRTEVLAGVRSARDADSRGLGEVAVLEIAPRADAIRQAIVLANSSDTVLLAGRGHEDIQEVDGEDLPLDDRVEARSAVVARGGRA